MQNKIPWYKRDIDLLPVNTVDIVTMTKNLSVMLEAGLTVTEALEVAVEQSPGRLKKIMKKVYSKVQAGESFGTSLEKAGNVFSPIFISSVKIGENSGTLSENLTHVARQMERDLSIRRSVQGAMLYPMVILISTFVLGLALATFVLPQLSSIFNSLNTELPASTRVLIWLAQAFKDYGFIITPSLIVLLFVLVIVLRRRFMQPMTHWFLLHIPAIKGFVYDLNRARFCRAIGTMLESGVPIQEAISIGASVLPNFYYRRSMKFMFKQIESGEGFATIIEAYPKLYPKMIQRMVAVGEHSGKMSASLLYLADFYEEKVAIKAKSLSTVIEPLLLIFIGLGVGFVAVAIFTPIYSVTEVLSL